MIEFLKQRKIVIIIVILVIILIGWKIYDSRSFETLNSEDILASNTKEKEKGDSKDNNDEENKEAGEIMAVHVTGEVKNPGVVRVKEGSRIEDIIEAAGGLTENADITDVNLAYVVEDGMKIRIPSNSDENIIGDGSEEAENAGDRSQEGDIKNEYITKDSGKGVILSEESGETLSSIDNLVININTAHETELEELPGIGPSLASRIIEYRNQNGNFKDIADIKNVTGIGDSKFEKIKSLIKVK